MFEVLTQALTAPGRRWCTAVSAASILLILLWPMESLVPNLCGELSRVPARDWLVAIGPMSPVRLLAWWVLMLMAMMAPLFADPMRHVWFSSLRTCRIRRVLECALGYLAIWVLVTPGLWAIAWLLQLAAPPGAALFLAGAVAFVWSATPLSQRARNRCHRYMSIGALGGRADREAVTQGLLSGSTCVAVCWPWMLVPIFVSGTVPHVAAMVLISLWLTLDRVYPARPALWQWPPAIAHALWRRALSR
jgi:hypothetical protein